MSVCVEPVLAFGTWKNNAELMVDCKRLGYLGDDGTVWDATYGLGAFWRLYRPRDLCATDLDPSKSPSVAGGVDFTRAPWVDRAFKYVVFDGPYKLNGTEAIFLNDDIYGVRESARWQDRMELLRRGAIECARCSDEWLIVKCQDQVVSGKIRWQTIYLTEAVEACGFRLYDRLDMPSYRPQPAGRSQQHARSNTSTALVFHRESGGWRPSPIDAAPTDENEGASTSRQWPEGSA